MTSPAVQICSLCVCLSTQRLCSQLRNLQEAGRPAARGRDPKGAGSQRQERLGPGSIGGGREGGQVGRGAERTALTSISTV